MATGSDVIINEIQVAGVSANDEFVELYNTTSKPIDISSWSIQYRGGSGSSYYKKNFEKNSIIPASGYFLIAHGGSGNYSGSIPFDMSWSQSLSSTGAAVYLVNDQKLLDSGARSSVVDKVAYGLSVEFEVLPATKPEENQSIERKNFKDTDNNKEDFETKKSPTPTGSDCLKNPEKCKIEEDKKEDSIKKEYPKGISITELFPNPFKSQYEEYIELYNGTIDAVDLKGWQLHDASKTGKYIFPESVILKAKNFLAVFKKDFKFALNNSGSESVTLLDPNGESVSIVEYSGSKKNVSYNFDGNRFRWSKFLTPGSENILNNEPTGKVKKDDDIFENVYANFSVSTGDADGDKVKVVWDFGDGHKSYLAKTRHKYQKTGKYQASVKLSDGSEDVIKNFSVKVEEFPHPKIRIVGFVANPEGSDTIAEKLIVQNKSKKKIDLIGWSVATGSKKLVNHPIAESFVLKKKETKELTREFSKFSLNNKEGKIELRYPDGKVADKIKYKKDAGIEEDEKYTKESGKWEWVPSQKSIKSIKSVKQEEAVSSVIGNQSSNTEVNIKVENADAEVAGVEIAKKEIVMLKKNDLKNIKISEIKIVETKKIKEIGSQYFFTRQNKIPDHYAISFLKNILSQANLFLNMVRNFFHQ